LFSFSSFQDPDCEACVGLRCIALRCVVECRLVEVRSVVGRGVVHVERSAWTAWCTRMVRVSLVARGDSAKRGSRRVSRSREHESDFFCRCMRSAKRTSNTRIKKLWSPVEHEVCQRRVCPPSLHVATVRCFPSVDQLSRLHARSRSRKCLLLKNASFRDMT
jgi:hypothetical protein